VLVWKIDRFGRSLKHLVNSLADLSAYGIAFISLRDNLDLSTPSGRLMFQIIGAMAEFERSLIQERVRAGLRVAEAFAFASAGGFFLYKIISGYLVVNLDLSLTCERKFSGSQQIDYLLDRMGFRILAPSVSAPSSFAASA
jgi:hypothetical protein